jgi:HSP20 family protein
MDRLIEDAWVQPSRFLGGDGTGFPVDIREEDDDVIVRASSPGMRPEDVDITVTGNLLRIQGEHRSWDEEEEPSKGGQKAEKGRAGQEMKRGTWRHREMRYGRMERSIYLPTDVDAGKTVATFENGILTLRMPKAESSKPKRIPISGQQAGKQPSVNAATAAKADSGAGERRN